MQPLKAHVENGRLVLDEPTDLPEGEIVFLHPTEAVIGAAVDFDEDERAALFDALDEGIDASRRGDHVDANQFARDLLART
jgi:hypothetical protein